MHMEGGGRKGTHTASQICRINPAELEVKPQLDVIYERRIYIFSNKFVSNIT